ncbi:MAG: hypothetical protein HYS12_13170 [Planctomycetes bacterium]|nr:hypothetical protein [Planctomycetota bacterium]
MKWLLRPSNLMLLFVAVVAGAAVWVYETTTIPARPVPLPVEAGDLEIAWLNAATSASAWQRFVQAIEDVTQVKAGEEAYPRLTTAVPEVAVPLRGGRRRLHFRWYKTTNEWNTGYWIEALLQRNPPPLAIIGGNTTDVALDQARRLHEVSADLPEPLRPLLLLTTATADKVPAGAEGGGPAGALADERVPLLDIYPGRTFRFCFSNRQMGEAVTGFIWSREELRPDASPVYRVLWQDDPYSFDLVSGFLKALEARTEARAAASDWGAVTGFAGVRGFPLSGLSLGNVLCRESEVPRQAVNDIPWSVGSFDRPNSYEVGVATNILDDLDGHPLPRKPLLLLCGQSQPSRRFVRALARLSPMQTRRFVAASGDAISFNTVYRDREVTWPIQDLPCSLIFFCHLNPVDEKRFRKDNPAASGTEDLLLDRDIVAALIEANAGDRPCADADELRQRLLELRLAEEGRPSLTTDSEVKLFTRDGNRSSGTGEHVVWLRPRFEDQRTLPEASLEVFGWQAGAVEWVQRGQSLRVTYTGFVERQP